MLRIIGGGITFQENNEIALPVAYKILSKSKRKYFEVFQYALVPTQADEIFSLRI